TVQERRIWDPGLLT
nr:immunoglobulin heavy chain junction region [Mus musculus]